MAVLGTGCNQDGQTNIPITAPSSDQQISLFSEVYRQYKIAPESLQYIEAHGKSQIIYTNFCDNHHKIVEESKNLCDTVLKSNSNKLIGVAVYHYTKSHTIFDALNFFLRYAFV